MGKKLFALAATIMAIASQASAHEMIIEPGAFEAELGSELSVALQSTHVFIVEEEVEDVSKITAGITSGGKISPSDLRPNESALRIDFSVKVAEAGSSVIAASKEGEIWSVTNEGSKQGPRRELEAQGLKVVRSALTDKYAKSIVNASPDDVNFGTVLGQDLEIVPVTNPAEAKIGGFFQVKTLHKGQPIAIPVWATYDGFVSEYQNTYAYYTESGADGVANIKLTAPGIWIVRASKENDPGVEGEYDSRTIRSTLTFAVK
jgi:uncharacterized GH25 family protein